MPLFNPIAKPFVKWAGGKRQLLQDIYAKIPQDFDTYIEPFVGGGAVLFFMLNNYSNVKKIVINDINKDLIDTYKTIKSDANQLVEILSKWQQEYYELLENDDKKQAYYYQKRSLFNQRITDETTQSALFIFLNKTCFNGLYRVNSKNEFNVPAGRYKKPLICDTENLQNIHLLLQKVEILNGDFEQTLPFSEGKTFFYFDPPYKPLTQTASFTSYADRGFDDNDQVRLANFCKKIDGLGYDWILSNSDTKNATKDIDFFDDLFKDFQISRVLAKRSINSNSKKRGQLTELLITN